MSGKEGDGNRSQTSEYANCLILDERPITSKAAAAAEAAGKPLNEEYNIGNEMRRKNFKIRDRKKNDKTSTSPPSNFIDKGKIYEFR